MHPVQRIRYSRQILLPTLGEIGQERLLMARVLLVGIGGLGSVVAMYLAAAGVGHLVLSDYDHVDLSNLQRQIAHHHHDIGRLKVDSARDTLLALNPEIEVTVIPWALDDAELQEQIQHCDVVVDACDNFETRFAINRACHYSGVPLVSGAAIGMEGQIAVFLHQKDTPCYQCLYPDDGSPGETCSNVGILAPLVGIIGAVQATETLKLIAWIGEPLSGRLLILNAATMEWRKLRLRCDPACPTCGLLAIRGGMSDGKTVLQHTTEMVHVTLPLSLINRLLHAAGSAAGREICGLVGQDAHLNYHYYPVTNIAGDPTRLFHMNHVQQLAAFRLMRTRHETLYALYHSHPHGPALPSLADIAEAAYPEALYLIASLGTVGVLELRGFRLRDEMVAEVILTI